MISMLRVTIWPNASRSKVPATLMRLPCSKAYRTTPLRGVLQHSAEPTSTLAGVNTFYQMVATGLILMPEVGVDRMSH